MAEPVTAATTGSLAPLGLTGAIVISLFPGIDPGAVMGAFAGAVVFVLSARDFSALAKLGYFIVAFIVGLAAAPTVTSVLSWLLPARVTINPSIGAVIAAAVSVKLLQWLIAQADNPMALVAKLRRKGGPE